MMDGSLVMKRTDGEIGWEDRRKLVADVIVEAE